MYTQPSSSTRNIQNHPESKRVGPQDLPSCSQMLSRACCPPLNCCNLRCDISANCVAQDLMRNARLKKAKAHKAPTRVRAKLPKRRRFASSRDASVSASPQSANWTNTSIVRGCTVSRSACRARSPPHYLSEESAGRKKCMMSCFAIGPFSRLMTREASPTRSVRFLWCVDGGASARFSNGVSGHVPPMRVAAMLTLCVDSLWAM